MTLFRRTIGVVAGLAVLACVLACGAVKQAVEDATNATQLGLAYTDYASKNKDKGPPDADAWAKWCNENGHADAAKLIPEAKAGGKYTFYWNVDMTKITDKNNTIIGYENKVNAGPTAVVIMASGSVQSMTPDQFKTAKKASDGK